MAQQSRGQVAADQVFRVVILHDQNQAQAEEGKRFMESLGYTPMTIDQKDGVYRVMYGNFSNQATAVRAKQTLDKEGVRNFGVTAAEAAEALPAGELFSVYVGDYNDQDMAKQQKSKLEAAGYAPVLVSRVGRFFQVYVGAFTMNDASACLGQIRQQNLSSVAKVVKAPAGLMPSTGLSHLPPLAATPAPQPEPATEAATASSPSTMPEISQSEEWKKLSEDQKRKVLVNTMMQQQLRQGNPLAQQVIDLDKRYQNLDQMVQKVVNDLKEKERKTDARRKEINTLMADAENKIRSEQYDKAISQLREILRLDENNELGQLPYAQRRIAYCESRARGESYEFQREDIEKQYKAMKERADSLTASPNAELADLQLADNIWANIEQLDVNKYGPSARSAMDGIGNRIKMIRQQDQASRSEMQTKLKWIYIVMPSAAGVILVLLFLVYLRGRKRHLELMRKVQEITSIRPMRELDTGATPLLGSTTHGGDTDIFAPRIPDHSQPGDPLGGMNPLAEPTPALTKGKFNKKKEKDKGKGAEKAPEPAPESDGEGLDDIFGVMSTPSASAAPGAAASGGLDDMGFDDIFGGGGASPASSSVSQPKAQPEPTEKVAAKSPQSGSSLEEAHDIFANLFSDSESEEKSEPAGATVAATQNATVAAGAAAESKKEEGFSPISFDDLVAVGDDSPAGPAPDSTIKDVTPESTMLNSDLLSVAEASQGGLTAGGEASQGGFSFGEISQSGLLSFGEASQGGLSSSHAGNTAPGSISMSADHGNGAPGAATMDERMKDSPFASLFDGPDTGGPGSPMGGGATGRDEDTEIPAIKLDMPQPPRPAPAPSAPKGASPASTNPFDTGNPEQEHTASQNHDLPSFSFDDLTSSVLPGNRTQGSGTETGGLELNFEGDAVGQMPPGWEGNYPYSSLSVQADTPPKGAHQYLCFEKQEGAGKALYTCRFPNISGVVGIEFDLRCNDKNKFLLGVYVEKDADFQQSIHTKILRSEAQTTPTIHMQGESAPYLLGSWTRIKYVVDLNLGKLNGYIDSTHVVRDLPLQGNPGLLNTLSIRDNINTTGILLLGNIKIYKIQ